MKKRFKKALFAFFKDEIMEENKMVFPKQELRIEQTDVDFHRITSEISLTQSPSEMNAGVPFEYHYQEQLKRSRKELFNECMKHIRIDKKKL